MTAGDHQPAAATQANPDDALVASFEQQAAYCDGAQAPFTAAVTRACADNLRRGGALRSMLPEWDGDAVSDAVALRVLGALHALTLSNADPGLRAFYPPQATAQLGPAETSDAAWQRELAQVIDAALRRHPEHLRRYLAVPPQTNEVGRSAVFLGGFAQLTQMTKCPLALLEIGASAGLNQWWHRYDYELADPNGPRDEGVTRRWGSATSGVQIQSQWRGETPDLPASFAVASQACSDLTPVDVHDEADALRLTAYIWADQPQRLQRVQAAIAHARTHGAQHRVEAADASTWLTRELNTARPGLCTVVMHSIMWQYMPADTQTRVRSLIEAASRHATASAPLAWLRLEPPDARSRPELRLTTWPGGEDQRLAYAHPHGTTVDWVTPTST